MCWSPGDPIPKSVNLKVFKDRCECCNKIQSPAASVRMKKGRKWECVGHYGDYETALEALEGLLIKKDIDK